jgi:hypothetical protein
LSRFDRRTALAGFLLLLFLPPHLARAAVILNFEGFPDSTILTNQYPGVTFTNAIILTAGISLNEFEFPPYSGVNVASDNNGPMTLSFASTITSFGAYFTYAEPLTIDAFNATDAVVASATSVFSNNEALSGDPGSSPNELIQVSFVGGISSVTITGDPFGGSFAMDNATYTTAGGTVPEPSSLSLCLLGVALAVGYWLARRGHHRIPRRALASVSPRVGLRRTSVGSLLLAALSAAPMLFAAPSHLLGVVAATPTTAVISTPTQVTVTASITDPALISNGVNLLQLNADGTTTILGTLNDDGINGDAYAGDKIFTILVTLNSASSSQIQLQVSAAFKGSLLRVKSSVINVFFQPADAPQQAVKALAQHLAAGNTSAAQNYVNPSYSLSALSRQGQGVIASILNASVLVTSQNDLRIFQAPFTTPSGAASTLEFTMIPGTDGQWIVTTW